MAAPASNRVDTEPKTENCAKDFFSKFSTVQTALENAQIGVWSWHIASGAMAWSSNLETIHGVPPGSFDGSYAGFIAKVHAEDRSGVDAAFQDAVGNGSRFRTRYRASRRAGEEECWIEATGQMGDGRDAPADTMLGLCYDVTGRLNLETELRGRAKQNEALAQLGERALAEPDLERLLNDAVSTVALTLSVDFVKILELLPGDRELVLRAGFGWRSNLVGTVLTDTAANSFARFTLDCAAPITVADFVKEARFEVPQYLRDHQCASGMTVTIAGRDGRAYGILGVCTAKKRDFGAQETAFLAAVGNLLAGAILRRQLEQRLELMIRDMRHRSGNLFSQLLALFSQTARTSKNIADLSRKYQARVLAMANAHRLITEGGWTSIPIMELLYAVLGPYVDRVSFDGPNIDLEPDPVFNLSAALHELTANAIKHGSLSRSRGQLELHWSASRAELGMTLTLEWIEKNGPSVRRPRRTGFGSRLIDLVIERQLNGQVTRTYAAKGLTVKLVVPLTHERWPSHAAEDARRE